MLVVVTFSYIYIYIYIYILGRELNKSFVKFRSLDRVRYGHDVVAVVSLSTDLLTTKPLSLLSSAVPINTDSINSRSLLQARL